LSADFTSSSLNGLTMAVMSFNGSSGGQSA
jgi:hypothetical protein